MHAVMVIAIGHAEVVAIVAAVVLPIVNAAVKALDAVVAADAVVMSCKYMTREIDKLLNKSRRRYNECSKACEPLYPN